MSYSLVDFILDRIPGQEGWFGKSTPKEDKSMIVIDAQVNGRKVLLPVSVLTFTEITDDVKGYLRPKMTGKYSLPFYPIILINHRGDLFSKQQALFYIAILQRENWMADIVYETIASHIDEHNVQMNKLTELWGLITDEGIELWGGDPNRIYFCTTISFKDTSDVKVNDVNYATINDAKFVPIDTKQSFKKRKAVDGVHSKPILIK